ncbi:MAG TPA: IS1595 family transposase, partial [Sphaerochaeta sp.]|nr:IS1595 family transposase [Sphaerochaeta sp.]
MVTDGFRAYQSQKTTNDYFHEFEVPDPLDNNSKLKQMYHVIFNAKAFVLGTFHGLENLKLQSYLDEYSYRFNRTNMRHLMFD